MWTPTPRAFRVLAALLVAVVFAIPAAAGGFPRIAFYGNLKGAGYPLWNPNGSLIDSVVTEVSRYDIVTFDVAPLTPYRPDALAAIRAKNPNVLLLGYVTGHYIWPNADPDSLVHFPTRYWRTVRDIDGFLYNKAGALFGTTNYAFADVNIAKKNASGTYVVAEALAQLFYNALIQSGEWDGVFTDTFCSSITWAQAPAESIDFARAGYPNAAAFDLGWRAGTDTLAARLRQLCGPAYMLAGSCIPGTKYPWYNGYMRENFPAQGGGTWYDNMFRDPGGYLTDDSRYRAPVQNFINTAAEPPQTPYSAWNMRKVRLGLASAALGSGLHVFGPGGRDSNVAPYHTWWYDEYAVDLANGRSSTLLKDTGWLGAPKAPWYQMIWVGTATDAVTNPNFETSVTTGWTFQHTINATLTRDTTGAPVGRSSARFTIPTPGTVDWQVNYTTVNSLPVYNYVPNYATFWAKASSPRTIAVVASATGNGDGGRATISIGTTWTQYQVAIVPASSGFSKLQFFLGLGGGEVWLDDVHFQPYATTIYRRDFAHGVVLVNPSSTPLTVPLDHYYNRLLGLRDLLTNTGLPTALPLVPPNDALFLIDPAGLAGVGTAMRDTHTLAIERPWPNPRWGRAPLTLAFTLATEDFAWLELFDASGRRIARQTPEKFATGRHEAHWNPGPLDPGVYFVRVRTAAGEVASTRWAVLR